MEPSSTKVEKMFFKIKFIFVILTFQKISHCREIAHFPRKRFSENLFSPSRKGGEMRWQPFHFKI